MPANAKGDHRRARGAQQAPPRGEDPVPGERDPKKSGGGFKRSVQYGRVFYIVWTGGAELARLGRPGLPEARKNELWERWKARRSISDSPGRKKHPGSIHDMLKATGKIAPPRRRTPRWALRLPEREEICRGLYQSSRYARSLPARAGPSFFCLLLSEGRGRVAVLSIENSKRGIARVFLTGALLIFAAACGGETSGGSRGSSGSGAGGEAASESPPLRRRGPPGPRRRPPRRPNPARPRSSRRRR